MILRVEDLHFSYGSRPVLEGVDFGVAKGELCAVLGNNGAGKSTLLKCAARILQAREGVVYLDEEDISKLKGQDLAKSLSYVAQRDTENARLSVFDTVLQGRKPHLGLTIRTNDIQVVEEVLVALEMEEFAFRYLDELSGGELQKVVIARALAQEPQVLLLDEPTSNLDLRNQLEVMDLMRRMTEEKGMAVLVAIHDINLASRFCDKYLLLHEGLIFASGGDEVLTQSNIEETYGIMVRLLRDNGRTLVVPQLPTNGSGLS